jgi:hypothetical protein
MTITVKNKKEFDQTVMELRRQGYNIITFGKMFAEMEKGNNLIVISK